ncbi:MAG: cupin domain-containing protein [Gammaproteobacteria bacterium]|nr:cupin domain-containing protein [Gammaproteobacteria bacterium]
MAIAITAITGCTGNQPLPDPLAAGWDGQKVCENLYENRSQRILRCTFPPGVGHERHFHAPHYGYILRGGGMQIRDENGTREVTIRKDRDFSSDGISWHEVLNVGETTVVVLIIEGK